MLKDPMPATMISEYPLASGQKWTVEDICMHSRCDVPGRLNSLVARAMPTGALHGAQLGDAWHGHAIIEVKVL